MVTALTVLIYSNYQLPGEISQQYAKLENLCDFACVGALRDISIDRLLNISKLSMCAKYKYPRSTTTPFPVFPIFPIFSTFFEGHQKLYNV